MHEKHAVDTVYWMYAKHTISIDSWNACIAFHRNEIVTDKA